MWDIESARVRVGLQPDDTSKDTQLTSAMGAALLFAEKYCRRKFMFKSEIIKLIHFANSEVQLARYPIVTVNEISNGTSAITNYHIDEDLGRITFDSRIVAHELIIDSEGGYEVLPDDLEMALWRLFDSCWSIMGGSGQTVGGGAIKAITSAGAKVEFDVGSSSSTSAGANGISDPFAESILDFYRLESC